MKIRYSLISNSSSSSFIIIFPKKPKTADAVFKYMFNGVSGYAGHDDNFRMSYKEISDRVFNDLKNNKINIKEELLHEFKTLVSLKLMNMETDYLRDKISVVVTITKEKEFDLNQISLILKYLDNYTQLRGLRDLCSEEQDYLRRDMKVTNIPWGQEPQEYKDKYYEIQKKYHTKTSPIVDENNKIINQLASDKVNKFISENDGWWYTILRYDDHSDVGSLMEHGNVFRNIKHITISHH